MMADFFMQSLLVQADLTAQGMPFQTVKVDFKDVDGAVLQGDTRGFVKIHTAGESDTILGATIVGSEAGGMICQVATTMQAGLGLAHLAAVIHPYPLKVSPPPPPASEKTHIWGP
jgi:pyruvate/2-oxoglutarate dehydrogenase complex dihydrolipoamide dehydrogenase (E3) component